MGYARCGEDADSYWSRMERMASRYPKCSVCEEPIYPGDMYLEMDGDRVCDECVRDYLTDHGYRSIAPEWDV